MEKAVVVLKQLPPQQGKSIRRRESRKKAIDVAETIQNFKHKKNLKFAEKKHRVVQQKNERVKKQMKRMMDSISNGDDCARVARAVQWH